MHKQDQINSVMEGERKLDIAILQSSGFGDKEANLQKIEHVVEDLAKENKKGKRNWISH